MITKAGIEAILLKNIEEAPYRISPFIKKYMNSGVEYRDWEIGRASCRERV